MHHLQPHCQSQNRFLNCPTLVMKSNADNNSFSMKERLLQLQSLSSGTNSNALSNHSDNNKDDMDIDNSSSNDAPVSNIIESTLQLIEKRKKNGLLVGKHRIMKRKGDNESSTAEYDREYENESNSFNKRKNINITVDTRRETQEVELMDIYEEAKKQSINDIQNIKTSMKESISNNIDTIIGKGTDIAKTEKKSLKLCSGAFCLPHPEKQTGGEDAYFISSCGSSIGIADGVGGWSEHGIDAGEFSREFMFHASDFVSSSGLRDPQMVLENAYEKIVSIGTSTACIVCFENNQFRASNIGDSGFLLLRSFEINGLSPSSAEEKVAKRPKRVWKIVLRSEEQQHYFNCPRQLGTSSFDRPCDAARYTYKSKEGDIVLLGTDGVYDNVSLPTILNYFNMEVSYYRLLKARENGYLEEEMNKIAKAVSEIASKASQCKTSMSPFALNARKNGMIYCGGKLDDITVVVAQLIPITSTSDDQSSTSDSVANGLIEGSSSQSSGNNNNNNLLSPNSVCESEQDATNSSLPMDSSEKVEGSSLIEKILQMRNESTYTVERHEVEESYAEIDGSEFHYISSSSESLIGTIKDTDISFAFEVTEN